MDIRQLEDKIGEGNLLGSQRTFIFGPEVYSCIDGGWGSGKSHSLCLKGLVLSAAIPGNVGLIGRFNATDLEDSTMALFFDICPPSWIKKYNKTRKVLTFRNNSQIIFRHINDPNPKRKHITSTNLGWFGVDQMEEIEKEHWITLTGRLRLARAAKHFGFGAANPNGKDWIYKMFYEPNINQPLTINPYATAYRKGNYLGIAVKSEENTKSNGGFVDDDFFIRLRNDMPYDFVAKYLDCSFEDFSGKIFKEYQLDSVHNIKPFSIPAHWETFVGIDVGGDVPWAVGIWRVDEQGNMILTKEFYKPSVLTAEVAEFIKNNSAWQGANFTPIIDPENKVALVELADHGIHCRPARKGQFSVRPGIIKVGGFMHVNPTKELPSWYKESQDQRLINRFDGKGSPRMFAFDNCTNWRREHDEYHWDAKKPGKPIKKDDHHCDETRYVADYLQITKAITLALVQESPALQKLQTIDPLAYQEWKSFDERQKIRLEKRQGGIYREFGLEETEVYRQSETETLRLGGYDWSD